MSIKRDRSGVCRAGCFLCLLLAWGQTTLALSNSTGPNGTNAQAVHDHGCTGQGVKIGFLSVDNAYANHNAFLDKDTNGNPIPGTSRVLIANPTGVAVNSTSHDTQIAGILVSNGDSIEPNQIGVAPGAILYNARVSGGLEQAIDALTAQGCRIIVSGFMYSSSPSYSDGQSNVTRLYDYYAYDPQYKIIFANATGNYDSTNYPQYTPPAIPGDAYNGITTGGLINPTNVYDKMGLYSLYGPTYDIRRKPEVAAPSPGQRVPTTGNPSAWTNTSGTTLGLTSWAVPHTAGVAALLLSYADSTTSEADDGKSEVIKAVIVNSTFPNINAKNGTWTDPANTTWHPERGYGRLDALRAYQTLAAGKILPGTITKQQGWAYRSFKEKNAVTERYYISGSKKQRLITTLTWHRKVSSGLVAEESLDIGLSIYDRQGQPIITLSGGKDNLRKADILLEQDDIYEIRVSKSSSDLTNTLRYYAFAFEVLDPLEGDWNSDYKVNLGDLTELLDCWMAESDPVADLSAFANLSAHWLTVDPRYVMP